MEHGGVSSLRLLGKTRAEFGSGSLDFLPNKRFQLLAYLAYQGEWVSRDKLVFLFWPDEPNHLARQNLRGLLKHVRKFPWLTNLEADENRLRWLVKTDVAAFKKALEKGNLEQALQIYQGEFCLDLGNGEANEFSNWLELERQTLHKLWVDAVLGFACELEAKENFVGAANVFERLHESEPLAEDNLRRYLISLARSEQRNKAQEVFESHKNRLEQDFKSEPEKETLQLMNSIRQGEVVTTVATLPRASVATLPKVEPRHNLPAQATLFVGRETERGKLAKLLSDPDYRLLSIVAPGGMGKTRLAVEVARTQLEHFEEVCFVSFAAVASPDLMVYTLADALELSLFGSKPPKEQVVDYLKNKKMLLVLDNLEHLLDGIDLISNILATAPEIKILSTSRERLGLQSEHLFDLYGLTLQDSSRSDALRLFAERAKHNNLDFVLEPHLQAVTKICELVGGMPLAIEIAASWSRLLTPTEIVRELEGSLDLLSTSARDLPKRHHSMRGVFEVSWQRLSEDEQTALRKLSLFQGGFEKGAAQEIADVDLTLLLSLLNKCFVWRDASGRFSQHPLILQYARHKAEGYSEEKTHFEEKHGLYFLALIGKLRKDLRTRKGNEARETLEQELPNIRAAWSWAVREQRAEDIARCSRDLSNVLKNHSHEGISLQNQVLENFSETNPQHHAALGHALLAVAGHESHLNYDAALIAKLTQQSLAFLEPLKEYRGIVAGLVNLASVASNRSDFVGSKDLLMAALHLARRHAVLQELPLILVELFEIESELRPLWELRLLMRTTLAELRELDDEYMLGCGLRLVGKYLVDNAEQEEGERLLRESLELLQSCGFGALTPLSDLAELAYKRGDMSEAERLAGEVFELTSKNPFYHHKAAALSILGGVKLAQGQVTEAAHLMLAGLRVGWTARAPHTVSYNLIFLAELALAKGEVKDSARLLSFLAHYPLVLKRYQGDVLTLLDKAKTYLLPLAFAEAQEESKSLTLEGIVTGILERGLEVSATNSLANNVHKV